MRNNKRIEVFSNLVKIETVEVIKKKIVPGSLVFESKNPFPSYYHEIPGSPVQLYMYIALNKHHSLEKIIRATQRIESGFEGKFEAGKGFLTIADEEFNVLRLRHFGDYNMVVKIQEAYSSVGLDLLTGSKKQGIHEAKIRIVKFLNLEEIGDGIFFDLKEDYHGYIEIPGFLKWNEFYNVTKKVRYNWTGSAFDAASGSFFYSGKLHEFVRIYSQKLNKEFLTDIRALYLEKIK